MARAGVAAAIAVFLVLLGATRMERNPVRGEAEALSAVFDAAYASVIAGNPVASVTAPGLTAAVVSLPRGADDVVMLTGLAGGECYAFYWNAVRGPVARVLVDGLPCEPGAAATTSGHNVYHRQTPSVSGHLPTPGAVFDWDGVYPDAQRVRPWFIPVAILLGGIGLWLAVLASRLALGLESPSRTRRRR